MRGRTPAVAWIMISVLSLSSHAPTTAAQGPTVVVIEGEVEDAGWVYLRALVDDDTTFFAWHEFLGEISVAALGVDLRTRFGGLSDVLLSSGPRDGISATVESGDLEVSYGHHSGPAEQPRSMGGFLHSTTHVPSSEQNEYHLILYSAGGIGRYNWTIRFEGDIQSLTTGTSTFLQSVDECRHGALVVARPHSEVPPTTGAAGVRCSVEVAHGFHGAWIAEGAAAGMTWAGPAGNDVAVGSNVLFLREPHAGRYDAAAAGWIGSLEGGLAVAGADIPNVLPPP